MSDEQDYALGELHRRLGNIVRVGTIAGVDYAAALVRVDLGELVTDWLPWLATRAGQDRVWNPPDQGEQVVLVCDGDPSQGVVLPGGLFSDAFPANGNAGKDRRITFKDGTVVEFDRDGSVLRVVVNPAGSVLVQIGATELAMQDGQAALKAAAITLDGAVTITGATTMQGAATMQAGAAVTGGLTEGGTNVGGTHTHTEQGDGQEVSAPH